MTVICRFCDISCLKEDVLFQYYLASLPWQNRKEKVMAFRHPHDRQRSLGAGILLKLSLEEAGIQDQRLSLTRHGKPVLVQDSGIDFSLSHSGNYAVCAISDRMVGADTEQIQTPRHALARRFFHPEEQAFLAQAEDPCDAFTRIWTRKESFLKRSGTGLAADLTGFSVTGDLKDGKGEAVQFHELSLPGHLLCVCTGAEEKVRFLPVDLHLSYSAY